MKTALGHRVHLNVGPTRAAFTLVELLIVISVIAILAALLLPALSRARDNAKTSVCLDNLKQMGLAILMYANEFEIYPPGYTGPSDFTFFLSPYLGATAVVYGDEMKRSRVVECPARTIRPTSLTANYSAHPRVMVHTAYGETPAKYGSLRRPTEVLIVADSMQFPNGTALATLVDTAGISTDGLATNTEYPVPVGLDMDGITTGLGDLRYRHGGRANLLFADGHVGTMRKGELREKNIKTNY
jgi:prepilin-type processing-associated H-X9-DG protein/prepilin-type N-terminal cleavage/methylation domain-containing protein